jgi:hypothetical protein
LFYVAGFLSQNQGRCHSFPATCRTSSLLATSTQLFIATRLGTLLRPSPAADLVVVTVSDDGVTADPDVRLEAGGSGETAVTELVRHSALSSQTPQGVDSVVSTLRREKTDQALLLSVELGSRLRMGVPVRRGRREPARLMRLVELGELCGDGVERSWRLVRGDVLAGVESVWRTVGEA